MPGGQQPTARQRIASATRPTVRPGAVIGEPKSNSESREGAANNDAPVTISRPAAARVVQIISRAMRKVRF